MLTADCEYSSVDERWGININVSLWTSCLKPLEPQMVRRIKNVTIVTANTVAGTLIVRLILVLYLRNVGIVFSARKPSSWCLKNPHYNEFLQASDFGWRGWDVVLSSLGISAGYELTYLRIVVASPIISGNSRRLPRHSISITTFLIIYPLRSTPAASLVDPQPSDYLSTALADLFKVSSPVSSTASRINNNLPLPKPLKGHVHSRCILVNFKAVTLLQPSC